MNNKNKLNLLIKKRYNVFKIIIVLLFLVVTIKLFNITILKHELYTKRLNNIIHSGITIESAQRGRIYDRNHKLLVDNIGVKSIYYKRISGVSLDDEVSIAKRLSEILDLNYDLVTESMIKDLWLIINRRVSNNKITSDEWEKLKIRKITSSDIELYKRNRITSDELKTIDKKQAYVYYLMNNGYSYQEKMIKKYTSDIEYAIINSKLDELKGVVTRLSWDRNYIYNDSLRGIFGELTKSGVTSDLKEHYLNKGYKLTDRVGISGLEYVYDEYLRGTDAIYKSTSEGLKNIVSEKRGNDIVLTIDIDLQLALEEIMEKEMIKTKNEPNTEYFKKAFVVISDPSTGDILALSAKSINEVGGEYKVYDYTSFLPISSVTVGSVIKGASMSVGYKEGVIDIGTTMKDECIKLYATKTKCSWLRSGLGNLNDIDALRLSSNSYQFKIAMKVSGFDYIYNGSFDLSKDPFSKYRSMFNSYGLGVKTGIDLKDESIGIVGNNDTPGLILDFSIGQYDTYTPLQLTQYINTIANNGERLKLNLLKEVHESTNGDISDKIIYESTKKILGHVDLDSKYIKRIQEGFHAVMSSSGLGFWYIDPKYDPAGKTGTSQSFYDSDNDGVIDKETITSTFVGYAPYENAKISIITVTPDISHVYKSGYLSSINRRITEQITKKYFEIYK